MTDYELNQLEEENYRRVDYIMPQEEFRQYWTRRKEENNEVGRFIDGVGQGAAAMIGMLPQAATEINEMLITGVKDPLRQAERNIQTGAEIVRKAGINMVQLFDWVGNKANDAATWAKRRGLKQQALAKRLEQEGKLTGDELRDADIIAAAASEADAMEPTPVEEEEDFDKAYERYQREKALEQEFAGVTDFQIGASKVSAPAATKEAYQITDEQPAETLSMLGSRRAARGRCHGRPRRARRVWHQQSRAGHHWADRKTAGGAWCRCGRCGGLCGCSGRRWKCYRGSHGHRQRAARAALRRCDHPQDRSGGRRCGDHHPRGGCGRHRHGASGSGGRLGAHDGDP
jgi:hypothetical protein